MDIKRPHYAATIKVVGLGVRSAEVVDRLIGSDLEGVDFVLVRVEDPLYFAEYDGAGGSLGNGTARTVPVADGNPTGLRLIEGNREELREALKDADMIVLIAGEGDEPELEAAPLVGQIARESGALIAGVIANPVELEGPHDSARIERGVQSLREAVDMLIMVPDSGLLPGFFAALRGR